MRCRLYPMALLSAWPRVLRTDPSKSIVTRWIFSSSTRSRFTARMPSMLLEVISASPQGPGRDIRKPMKSEHLLKAPEGWPALCHWGLTQCAMRRAMRPRERPGAKRFAFNRSRTEGRARIIAWRVSCITLKVVGPRGTRSERDCCAAESQEKGRDAADDGDRSAAGASRSSCQGDERRRSRFARIVHGNIEQGAHR